MPYTKYWAQTTTISLLLLKREIEMKTINVGVGGFCWRPEKAKNKDYIFLMPLSVNGYCILLVFASAKESSNVHK